MLDQLKATGDCLGPLGVARYLKVVALASRPEARGRRLGARVMEAITARADAEGLPVRIRGGRAWV